MRPLRPMCPSAICSGWNRSASRGRGSRRFTLTSRVLQEMQLAAVRAERQSIFALRRQKAINATDARRLVRELDLLEAHYEG